MNPYIRFGLNHGVIEPTDVKPLRGKIHLLLPINYKAKGLNNV